MVENTDCYERNIRMIETDLFDFAYVPDWYGQLDELSETGSAGAMAVQEANL